MAFPIHFSPDSSPVDWYPFALTQPVEQIQTGAFNAVERWMAAGFEVTEADGVPVNARWQMDSASINDLAELESHQWQNEKGEWLAGEKNLPVKILQSITVLSGPAMLLASLAARISTDIALAKLQPIDTNSFAHITVVEQDSVYADQGVRIEPNVVLDASAGPIWLRKNSLVMAGSCLRGPLVLGERSVVKMGGLLYGPIATGADCTLGGEVKHCLVMQGSNKAHHGYLGDSIVGRWCNLGAGTTNSNVKNTAGMVSWWSEATQTFEPIGLKAGVLLGDFCRTGINTAINTGTVIGPCCNLFGASMPPRHLPAFRWGNDGQTLYNLNDAFRHINNWMAFKNQSLSQADQLRLTQIHQSL